MSLNTLTWRGSRRIASIYGPSCRTYSRASPRLAEATTQAQPPTSSEGTGANSGVSDSSATAATTAASSESSKSLPFEQQPFQCFQEARKVLAADREDKLHLIEAQKIKIAEKEAEEAGTPQAVQAKKTSLMAMRRHLQWLKVQADINDPVIKKRFEDGKGDMNKPIYRYLADQKWRSYDRKIIMQRLETMKVLPDIFPGLNPRTKVVLSFRRRKIPPGEFVPSIVSSVAPSLHVQAFDKGPRYITVAIVDPDVPHLEKDSFTNQCHFLATNILIDPTKPDVELSDLSSDQLILDWLPPTVQKGAPYHRLCAFVFEQPGRLDPMARSTATETEEEIKGRVLDVAEVKKTLPPGRDYGASFIAAKLRLHPAGVHMFRSIWDEWTAGVMIRHNISGADMEFVQRKPDKLPPKKRDTGRFRQFAKLG